MPPPLAAVTDVTLAPDSSSGLPAKVVVGEVNEGATVARAPATLPMVIDSVAPLLTVSLYEVRLGEADISVTTAPEEVAVTPSGRYVFCTNVGSNFISQIDARTNTLIRNITVGTVMGGLAFGK